MFISSLRPMTTTPALANKKSKSVLFGDASDKEIAKAFLKSRAGLLNDIKLKQESPFFEWRVAKHPIKKFLGTIADWVYWLWQGVVKDLKHIQQSLFKPSKPTEEKL